MSNNNEPVFINHHPWKHSLHKIGLRDEANNAIFNAMDTIVPALFDLGLSDSNLPSHPLSETQALSLFNHFKQHSLFNWNNSHNGCEGRADAVCQLLEEWGIPNNKAWIFSGSFLRNHVGELKQNWKYHVAPVLAVQKNAQILNYVLDPATADSLQLIDEWAAAITQLPHSYYFIRQANWYIFPEKDITSAKWNSRNRQNHKWMIQCIAGINSLTAPGKARLCFNKNRIKNTLAAFNKAKAQRPELSGF